MPNYDTMMVEWWSNDNKMMATGHLDNGIGDWHVAQVLVTPSFAPPAPSALARWGANSAPSEKIPTRGCDAMTAAMAPASV